MTPSDEFANNSDSDDLMLVGDGPGSGHPISMKQLQAWYNEITGRTERLSQRFTDPIQLDFSDIEQLNIKIFQTLEQFNVISQIVEVVIYHVDDSAERFSSFERAKIYNKSGLSPTESVFLKYSFLMKLPQVNKAQPYTVSIRLLSRLGAQKSFSEKDIPIALEKMLRIALGPLVSIDIDFVDYVVARTMLQAAVEWHGGLKKATRNRWIHFLQKRSEFSPPIFGFALAGLILLLEIKLVIPSLIDSSAGPTLIVQGVVTSFAALALFKLIGEGFGRGFESAIDRIQEASYINLNRADENLVQSEKSSRIKMLITMGSSVLATVTLGVIASLIANYISGS
jgi:hypothetical protein